MNAPATVYALPQLSWVVANAAIRVAFQPGQGGKTLRLLVERQATGDWRWTVSEATIAGGCRSGMAGSRRAATEQAQAAAANWPLADPAVRPAPQAASPETPAPRRRDSNVIVTDRFARARTAPAVPRAASPEGGSKVIRFPGQSAERGLRAPCARRTQITDGRSIGRPSAWQKADDGKLVIMVETLRLVVEPLGDGAARYFVFRMPERTRLRPALLRVGTEPSLAAAVAAVEDVAATLLCFGRTR